MSFYISTHFKKVWKFTSVTYVHCADGLVIAEAPTLRFKKNAKFLGKHFKISLGPSAPKLQVMDLITLIHQILPTTQLTTIYVSSVSQFNSLHIIHQ